MSAKGIIKNLEHISAHGYHNRDVFRDFLDMALAAMEALPDHLRSARSTGKFAEDTEETKQLFKRMEEKYSRSNNWQSAYKYFAQALNELLETTDEYQDTIGDVFMLWCNPNARSGQFFTPFHLAQVMASITAGDLEKQIHHQIKEAAKDDPLLGAIVLAGMIIQEREEARQYFFNRVLPVAIPHIKPITVNDPACGSGVMFIALASITPRWILELGLVQFWGQDIDETCVKMARLNMMIYGLNGFSIKCALAMAEDPSNGIPIERESILTNANELNQLSLF